jgi:hypothetical protein
MGRYWNVRCESYQQRGRETFNIIKAVKVKLRHKVLIYIVASGCSRALILHFRGNFAVHQTLVKTSRRVLSKLFWEAGAQSGGTSPFLVETVRGKEISSRREKDTRRYLIY